MSLVNELIEKIDNPDKKQELEERLELVKHKIKFMDVFPVCILDTFGNPNLALSDFVIPAGGNLTMSPEDAAYIVYFENEKNLADLMRSVPVTLNAEWDATKFGRICLLADDYQLNNAEQVVNLIEDLAEIMHPGQFIFGFEGDKWIRFTA